MARFRIAVRIIREEYDAFRLLLKEDFEFPTTYDGWLESTAKELEKRRARC